MTTVYPSTIYSIQEIQNLNVQELNVNNISDSVLTIENDKISGVIDPVSDSQICNLNYLIEAEPRANGPLNSVQFNDLGNFNGSSNFKFQSNKLSTDVITNGTVIFSEGTLDGIVNDTTLNSAVNKSYVDNSLNLNETTLLLGTSITYSANQMVNGIIYRDPIVNNTISTQYDTTSDAISLVQQFENNSIGNSVSFYLKNITSNPDVFIFLKPGTGVTFNNSSDGITIPQNYLLKAKIIIISLTEILMLIESVEYSGSVEEFKYTKTISSSTPYTLESIITNSLKCNTALFDVYYDDESLNVGPLTLTSIIYGQAYRKNLTNDITLFFPDPVSSFLIENNEGLVLSGYYRFIFRNADTVYNVTLSGSNGWILDSYSNYTIPPQTSVLLWLYVDGNNNSVKVYQIGKMSI